MFPSPCLAIGASFRWLYLLLYTFFLLETRLWLQTKHISIFPGYPRREHFSTGASADFLTVLRCFCVVISVARLPTAQLWNILRPHGRRPGPTAKHLIAIYPNQRGCVCAPTAHVDGDVVFQVVLRNSTYCCFVHILVRRQ